MKILMLSNRRVDGKLVNTGDVIEINDKDGRYFISNKFAKKAPETPKKTRVKK